jgi:hypothetical protein
LRIFLQLRYFVMSPRTQSILTIIGTLLIGMILGSLLTGTFISTRAQRAFGSLANEQIFVRNLESLLESDEQQKRTLSPLFHRYGRTLASVTAVYYKTQFATLDSMKREITPLLTPEQQQRLSERLEWVTRRQRQLFQRNSAGEP